MCFPPKSGRFYTASDTERKNFAHPCPIGTAHLAGELFKLRAISCTCLIAAAGRTEALGALAREQTERWGRVIRQAGITAQ